MKTILIIFVSVFLAGLIQSQEIIDYRPKKLQKELQRETGTIDFLIIKIDVAQLENSKMGRFFYVYKADIICNYLYVGRVNSCRAGACNLSTDKDMASYEYFDYYILYDLAKKVKIVKVYNYAATHGHEVSSKGWLKQFVGYNGSNDLVVGKNVDAISSATISVNGISDDIQSKTRILNSAKLNF